MRDEQLKLKFKCGCCSFKKWALYMKSLFTIKS
jgi:hypothetical protein